MHGEHTLRVSNHGVSKHFIRGLIFAAVTQAAGLPVRAATPLYSWIGGSGSWSVASNWSSASVPIADSAVRVVHNDAVNRAITFDFNYPTQLRAFTLDQTGAGTTTFTLASGSFGADGGFLDSDEYIGLNGRATFLQTGGTNHGNFFNQIHLAENPGSAGTYNLSGGTIDLPIFFTGVNGNGTFILSGGFARLEELYVGGNTGTVGRVNLLSGGSLITGGTYVGHGFSAGRMDQAGGEHRTTLLVVGDSENAVGTYNLSAGSLTTSFFQVGNGNQFVPGNGTFNQTGGDATAVDAFIGTGTLGVGSVFINGGSFKATNQLLVGYFGKGNFTLGPAGNVSLTGIFDIGETASAAGTFTTSGNFSAYADGVGIAGAGTIIQNGGMHITTRVILGDGTTGTGAYVLNSGTLAATNEYVGGLGIGTFTQTGGVNLVGDNLFLAETGQFDCYYNQSGGTLSAAVLANSFGTFTQTGGVATFSGGISGFGTVAVSGTGKLVTSRIDQYALIAGNGGAVTCTPNGIGPAKVSYLRTLSITGTGKWDLNNNDLVIEYGPLPITSATARTWIASAFSNGTWTGPGLTSSAAAAQASAAHKTALGYAQATDLFTSFPALFDGTVVSGESLLVRYTFAGDANLDGSVTTQDFTRLAAHFNQASAFWSDGDFNYDGKINALDFNALTSNFGSAIGSPGLGSIVPEPGVVFGLIVPGALAADVLDDHRALLGFRTLSAKQQRQ